MRPATKHDGLNYWEYVLIYFDDILAISHCARSWKASLRLKEDPKTGQKFGPPNKYMGATLALTSLKMVDHASIGHEMSMLQTSLL